MDTPYRFKLEFNEMQEEIHINAINHGWWEGGRNDGEIIALIHSELSEALEAMRKGNQQSEKIPGHTHVEEELADAVIRIMDYAGAMHYDLASAIMAKHKYNKGRPYKHGKKF